MNHGLPAPAVVAICGVFSRFPALESAVLYGSRAKGNFKAGSDIDLTLHGKSLTTAILADIGEALDDLLLPYQLDLSLHRQIKNDSLLNHIERVGVIFYERHGSAGNHQGAAQMKKGWPARPLSDFVKSKGGNNKIIKGTQSDQPGEGLIQGFSASGPDVWVKVADYNRPGVVISAVGARCGKTFLADGEWTAIANTHVLLPGDDIDNRWLWYRTNDEDFWVRGGSAQPFVKVKDTLEQPCKIPPLAEQQRIVGVLDEAFAGLATAQANAAKNLQNARALFESHLQSVFTHRGKGWVEKTLEEVVDEQCTLSYGIVQPGHEYPNGLPVVRPTDLTAKTITLDGLKRIDPKLAGGYRRTTLRGGELLLCVRGSTGIVSVTAPELAGANVTRGIVPIVFAPSLLRQDFGFFLMTSEAVQSQIRAKTYGTALMQINIGDLRKIAVSFPPLEKQSEMAAKLDALAAETQRLESHYAQKLAALAALKKSLLHDAFRGAL